MLNRSLSAALATICLLLCIHVRGADDAPVPDLLKVPADCKELCRVEARGVQIYESVDVGVGAVWMFEAPLATLESIEEETKRARSFGWHFDGPTWAASDGSWVKKVDAKDAVVKAPAPNAASDIPWLRIAIKSGEGKPGFLSKAVFVQRINTKGGQVPATSPPRAGIRAGVEYTATYVFFERSK